MTLNFLYSGFYWLSGHQSILEKFQLSAMIDKNMDWPTNLENGSNEEVKNNSGDEDDEGKSLSSRSNQSQRLQRTKNGKIDVQAAAMS